MLDPSSFFALSERVYDQHPQTRHPKGSLQDATIQLFARAGFNTSRERALVTFRRSTILNRLHADSGAGDGPVVADGVLDSGLTGQDWIAEHAAANGVHAAVVPLAESHFMRSKASESPMGPAVPEESRYQSVRDLEGATIAHRARPRHSGLFSRQGHQRQR